MSKKRPIQTDDYGLMPEIRRRTPGRLRIRKYRFVRPTTGPASSFQFEEAPADDPLGRYKMRQSARIRKLLSLKSIRRLSRGTREEVITMVLGDPLLFNFVAAKTEAEAREALKTFKTIRPGSRQLKTLADLMKKG